jgi:hypothetical protein
MFYLYRVFYVHVTVHRNKFLFNKTNRRTNFPNLFCQETLHVSGSSSAHHQDFSTVHSALVSGKFDDSFQARPEWNWFYSVAGGYSPTCNVQDYEFRQWGSGKPLAPSVTPQ